MPGARTGRTMPALSLLALALGTPLAPAHAAHSCVRVMATPSGFLAIRSGPGVEHLGVNRVRSGALLGVDLRTPETTTRWWRVTAILERAGAPGRKDIVRVAGWADARYLQPVACAPVGAPQGRKEPGI